MQSFQTIHVWTSSSVIDQQILVITEKATTVVTGEEFSLLASHLQLSVDVDLSSNGKIGAHKYNGGSILLSNKPQNDTEPQAEHTVCFVDKDVLSLHTTLQKLVEKTTSVWAVFERLCKIFPELGFVDEFLNCLQANSFQQMLQKHSKAFDFCVSGLKTQTKDKRSIIGAIFGDSELISKFDSNIRVAVNRQDSNFEKIQKFDHDLVQLVNTLIKNEKTSDHSIRGCA